MAKKILVVDDDRDVVRYLSAIFEDHGYEVLQAFDGAEALEVMERTIPDLITLDLEMEKQWGSRFFRTMDKDQRFQNVPVVVVSGMPRADLAIKRAAAVVKKPFDPDQLVSVVREQIGS
jgi:CheY-like chemotaxis protein